MKGAECVDVMFGEAAKLDTYFFLVVLRVGQVIGVDTHKNGCQPSTHSDERVYHSSLQ